MYCFPTRFYANLLFVSWVLYQTISHFCPVLGTKQVDRSCIASDLCSGGAWFESWPGLNYHD